MAFSLKNEVKNLCTISYVGHICFLPSHQRKKTYSNAFACDFNNSNLTSKRSSSIEQRRSWEIFLFCWCTMHLFAPLSSPSSSETSWCASKTFGIVAAHAAGDDSVASSVFALISLLTSLSLPSSIPYIAVVVVDTLSPWSKLHGFRFVSGVPATVLFSADCQTEKKQKRQKTHIKIMRTYLHSRRHISTKVTNKYTLW